MKVWLDDKRPAPPGWVRVRTTDAAIALLDAEVVSEISLDHDLGPEDSCHNGYDVLVHIEMCVMDGCHRAPDLIHVHSANPPARKRMEAAIAAIKKARLK